MENGCPMTRSFDSMPNISTAFRLQSMKCSSSQRTMASLADSNRTRNFSSLSFRFCSAFFRSVMSRSVPMTAGFPRYVVRELYTSVCLISPFFLTTLKS
jgi:hypothetical protein